MQRLSQAEISSTARHFAFVERNCEEFASVSSVDSVVYCFWILTVGETFCSTCAYGMPVREDLLQRIAAEFFQRRFREHDRDHRFTDHGGRGDGADIAPFNRGGTQ